MTEAMGSDVKVLAVPVVMGLVIRKLEHVHNAKLDGKETIALKVGFIYI